MHLDVQDLRNFYYRSTLGRAAQAAIRGRMIEIWPEAKGQTVVGFGFAVPLLRPYLADARRVIGLMPGPQGVMPWPAGMSNVSVLTEETMWPVETGHVDKLVVMHGLETSSRPSELLDECWRVLGPGGRALFVVPNRAGLWSRTDRTPFGFGRPYSASRTGKSAKSASFPPRTPLFRPVHAALVSPLLAEIGKSDRKNRAARADCHGGGRSFGRGDQTYPPPERQCLQGYRTAPHQGSGWVVEACMTVRSPKA